jgi:hypothetical protein
VNWKTNPYLNVWIKGWLNALVGRTEQRQKINRIQLFHERKRGKKWKRKKHCKRIGNMGNHRIVSIKRLASKCGFTHRLGLGYLWLYRCTRSDVGRMFWLEIDTVDQQQEGIVFFSEGHSLVVYIA